MIIFLCIYAVITTALLGVGGFYLYRFARIIMILEDDFGEATESLDAVEQSFEKLLKMQLFFDSKEVKVAAEAIMQDIKIARMDINKLVLKFLERSKSNYVVVIEEEEPIEQMKDRLLRDRLLKERNMLDAQE